MLQFLHKETKITFCTLVNSWLNNFSFPDDIKKSITIFISKKQNPTCTFDLRPISLNTSIYLTIASFLNHELINFCLHNQIISPFQRAFYPKRSLNEILFDINLRLTNYNSLYIILIDIKRAYNSVNHCLLWKRLYEESIPQNMILNIKNLYKNSKTSA